MSEKTTKRDLEWALRTIANLPFFFGEDEEQWRRPGLAKEMADLARQALSGKFAGTAKAAADHIGNIGHPDWIPRADQDPGHPGHPVTCQRRCCNHVAR